MTVVVVPTFMREPPDLAVTVRTLRSVCEKDPAVELVVVDDCSPARALVDEMAGHGEELQFHLLRNEENEGFSRTVNRGLRIALDSGQDAILLNADMEVLTRDFSQTMAEQRDSRGEPAAVVGALLLYPGGDLIQHAGVFCSFLTRIFDHRYRYAPANLPEALRPWRCPVTGAFQFIRHSTLAEVGLYDEDFRMVWEDVDYCLRVFEAGHECLYTPDVRAIHYESLFRGRADRKLSDWQVQSLKRLLVKHASTNLAAYMPELV